MKVSIGMPVYNGEKYLEQSIRSVLNQSYKDFEFIISNDGSTDRSREIIRAFKDQRIVFIDDDQNRGISFRLNQQLRIARGKYFVRMDADDIMFPKRVERQNEFLEQNKNIDVVGSYAVVVNDINKVLGMRTSKIPKNVNELFSQAIFIHPTVVGKTSWFNDFKYSEDLNGVEDYDLWIRGFKSANYFVIPEPLLFYRELERINITTYLYRQAQFRKCARKHRNQIKRNHQFSIIYSTYLKAALILIMVSLKKDKYMIKLRNEVINDKMYVVKLEEMIYNSLQ